MPGPLADQKEPCDDRGPEDHSSEGGPAGAGQAAGQCEPLLQDDGLQPRQLLSLQVALAIEKLEWGQLRVANALRGR